MPEPTSPAPDLGVVIVSWNRADLLVECLESLAASAGATLETVVVDNASSDDSVARVRARFPAARLIVNERNLGFARAANQGLAVTSARYRLLLNSDTRVERDALARLVAFMDATPRAGACGPRLTHPDGRLQPSGRAFPTPFAAALAITPVPGFVRRWFADPQERRDYAGACEVDELTGAALCVRARALDEVGAFDESYFFFGEDVDLCWRLKRAGWTVHYRPEATVIHHLGGSRRGVDEGISLQIQRAYVLLMRKHRPGAGAAAVTAWAAALTLLKAVRRGLPALLRGGVAALRASWRAHRDELRWLRTGA
jgi:GT2 family glycosyltransferase